MSEPASISLGIASRYATAVFDLAREDNAVDALAGDIGALAAALDASADLNSLISSPVYSRDEQAASMTAIAGKMGLTGNTTNLLRLMAGNRRLFVLPQLIAALNARIAEHRGEVTAEVTSAQPLSAAQSDELAKALAKNAGKTVKITATVDESIIGGLIVKMGSKMIDTSIASKLSSLQNTMKEVR